MSERKTDRKHSSSNLSGSGESYRSHRSGSGGDAYRREVDTDSLAPPPPYHNRPEPQVATRSSYGRSPSELQVMARARPQYPSPTSHVSRNDDRQLYSSAAKQRVHLAVGDNEDNREASTLAQSDIPVYNRRMMSQENFLQLIALGDSAFSTIEPYEEPQRRPELLRAPSAAPASHTAKRSKHSEAPSYRTVDSQEKVYGA
jgi:hypothetical protein